MPQKESNKRGVWLWRAVFIVSSCGLVVVLALLAPIVWEYFQGAAGYDEARRIAKPEESPVAQTPTEAYSSPIDFDSLAEQNPDVVAWLTIEDTDIDYPVVWNGDNEFYLTHGFNRKKNVSGCLFLDELNQTDWSNGNNLIFGHNMKDGSMFGTLKRFRDEEYAKSHDKLTLYTPAAQYELLPFAAYGEKDTGAYMSQPPDDAAEAKNWMTEISKRSDVDFGVAPEAGDRIVTLVTCSSAKGEERFVLGAIMRDITDEVLTTGGL